MYYYDFDMLLICWCYGFYSKIMGLIFVFDNKYVQNVDKI